MNISLQVIVGLTIMIAIYGLLLFVYAFQKKHKNIYGGLAIFHLCILAIKILPLEISLIEFDERFKWIFLPLTYLGPLCYYLMARKTLNLQNRIGWIQWILIGGLSYELIYNLLFCLNPSLVSPPIFIKINYYGLIFYYILIGFIVLRKITDYRKEHLKIMSSELPKDYINIRNSLGVFLAFIIFGIIIFIYSEPDAFKKEISEILFSFIFICLSIFTILISKIIISERINSIISTIDFEPVENNRLEIDDLNESNLLLTLNLYLEPTTIHKTVDKNYDIQTTYLKNKKISDLIWFKTDKQQLVLWSKNAENNQFIKIDLRFKNKNNNDCIGSAFIKKVIVKESSSFLVYVPLLIQTSWLKNPEHEIHKGVRKQFENFINTLELFKQRELDLVMVCRSIKISPAVLSESIDAYKKSNFYDFINFIRVTKAKINLKKDKIDHGFIEKFANEHGFLDEREMNKHFLIYTGNSFNFYFRMYGRIELNKKSMKLHDQLVIEQFFH